MVNKVILLGYVGADPEIRVLETGTKMARFNLATTEIYYNTKGERFEDTQWHSIVLWNAAADVAQKDVVKGSQVQIEGKIKYRQTTDKTTHVVHNITEIIGNNIQVFNRKTDDAEQPLEAIAATPIIDPDGLPF